MIDILYEDSGVIVVNKPQRVPVEPDEHGRGSLVEMAREHCGEAFACHRLDTMTGGLVLLAKTEEARDAAFSVFREGAASGVSGGDGGVVTKVYLCETIRTPQPESGEMVGYMTKDAARSLSRVYDRPVPGAKLARTLYSVIRPLPAGICLVAARLLTGRTHQIRAQFAAAGWPILGDDKYGDWRENRRQRVRVQRLWAVGMAFGETRGCLEGLSGKEFWARATFAPWFDTRLIGRMRVGGGRD
ncbi:MAG: RluA family pseudouridine synthase [Oscillospiraceae bacterium]|jgi:23S rRNA pseudouridine955/2504/2580 synthase|nr:RluA family pseudouridine synthase [Oscillospiraceae bacterium]